MMKKYSAIVFASTLALALTACGGDAPVEEGAGDPAASDTTGALTAAGGTGDTTEATDPTSRAVPFNIPPEESVTSPIKPRNLDPLIRSSTTSERLNSTTSGRSDPFAGRVIFVRPVSPDPEDVDVIFPRARTGQSEASDRAVALGGIPTRELPASAGNASSGGTARGGSTGTPTASRPSGSASSSGSGSGSSTTKSPAAGGTASQGRAVGSSSGSSSSSSGGSSTTTANSGGSSGSTTTANSGGTDSVATGSDAGSTKLPDLAARPPIPEPTLARAVQVTGVILVGSNYQAIVKAPDEPTSRYVTVGQRLSNGKVLVKRIESQGSEPVVILEEEGVEVVRSIGAPTEEDVSADVTAALPSPPAL